MPKARKRLINGSWLQAYSDYIVKHESPDIFHLWVGATIVAAALRRNVCIDRGAYQVWPNQYVFLIAASAGCKKSSAMEIGLHLLDGIDDVNIVHGRATVEGLMDEMDRTISTPAGKIKPDGSLFIHADELSFLFGKASYITDLISFLTAAYTAKAKLDFLTRGKGMRSVRNPCPTVLAGCTPEQLGEVFPSMTLHSGFMGRVVLVYGMRGRRVAKPQLDPSMEDTLIHDLGVISELNGVMELAPDADKLFDDWYESLDDSGVPAELASFHERKHDHVLKLALIFSVAESNRLVVTRDHLIGAMAAIEDVEAHLAQAVTHIGATSSSLLQEQILTMLRAYYPKSIAHSKLLRAVAKRLSRGREEFHEIVTSLEEMGRVRIEINGRLRSYTYIPAKGDQ